MKKTVSVLLTFFSLTFVLIASADNSCPITQKTFTGDSARALVQALDYAGSEPVTDETNWIYTYKASGIECSEGHAYWDFLPRGSCSGQGFTDNGKSAASFLVNAFRTAGVFDDAYGQHSHIKVAAIQCVTNANAEVTFSCDVSAAWTDNCQD